MYRLAHQFLYLAYSWLYGVHRLPGSLTCTLQSTRSYEFVADGEGAEDGRVKRQIKKKSKANGALRPLRPISAYNSLLAIISAADESLEYAQASTETMVL